LCNPIETLEKLSPGPLAVLVGPEGGFSLGERERLVGKPYVVPLSLGPRIMRADTAAVAVLALVNAVLGDWRRG
jgi:16S rRNA (uracil1498-N3)-methyltransferase